MSVNWAEYAAIMEEKVNKLGKADRFRFWCTNLVGAPYGWGSENIFETDCSGTVAFALWMMGYNVRTTAEGFMRNLFTEADEYDKSKIQAVFYTVREDQKHGDRTVKAGTAIHVSPIVGRGVVVNAGNFVTISTKQSIDTWFIKNRNAYPKIRSLNMAALEKISRDGNMSWGIDPILEGLRNA